MFLAFALSPALAQQQGTAATPNPLVQLLHSKGILSAADVASIEQAGSPQAANQKLTDILLQRGVISQSEHDRLTGQATPLRSGRSAPPYPAPTAARTRRAAALVRREEPDVQAPPFPTEPGAPSVVERVPTKQINEALSPFVPCRLMA